ncbi:hypothetical protein ACERK3_08485 [Phycisphaerales bacterium AB-hyl4]|uniref:DUF7305 domain-containing protein n=1 Tax=Natronomicrosphaera hydrolytica TaxID=3242702 RepID=A0ABV4U6F2_9BACT
MHHATTTRSARPSPATHQRGVALMLVVVALAMATMLAVPFLIAQGTSAAVGKNISDHHRARAIAESGIEMGLAYIHQHSDWRNAQTPGVWLAEMPYANGTIHIHVQNEDDDASPDALGDVVILISTGRYNSTSHTARARVQGQPPSPGGSPFTMPYGIALKQTFNLVGNAEVNAMDSRVDSFSPHVSADQAATHDALVATNSSGQGHVQLTGSATLYGNVHVGPGEHVNPDQVVNVTGNTNVFRVGTKEKLEQAMEIPDITMPPNMPPSQGDYVINNWAGTEQTMTAGTYRYDDFEIGGDSTLYIEGDVTIIADGTFKAGNSGRIFLKEGARLNIYTERLYVDGNARIKHTNHYDPTAITVFQTGSDSVWMRGSAEVAAGIVAPNAGLDMRGNTRLFGGFYGDSVQIHGSSRLTQDIALYETSQTGGGPGTGGSGGNYRVRWLSTTHHH